MERMKTAMKNKTDVVRTKVNELIENTHTSPKEGMGPQSSNFEEIVKKIEFLRKIEIILIFG